MRRAQAEPGQPAIGGEARAAGDPVAIDVFGVGPGQNPPPRDRLHQPEAEELWGKHQGDSAGLGRCPLGPQAGLPHGRDDHGLQETASHAGERITARVRIVVADPGHGLGSVPAALGQVVTGHAAGLIEVRPEALFGGERATEEGAALSEAEELFVRQAGQGGARLALDQRSLYRRAPGQGQQEKSAESRGHETEQVRARRRRDHRPAAESRTGTRNARRPGHRRRSWGERAGDRRTTPCHRYRPSWRPSLRLRP